VYVIDVGRAAFVFNNTDSVFEVGDAYWNAGQTLGVGDMTVNGDLTVTGDVSAATYTGLPVAATATAGIISTGAQNIDGAKTFKDAAKFSESVQVNAASATRQVDIRADSNTTTDYSLRVSNNAETARIDLGGYGANFNISYTINHNASEVLLLDIDNNHRIRTTNTSLTAPVLQVQKAGNSQETAGNAFVQFGAGGSNCGKIQSNGTNTAAFASSSDERLKKDITPLTGSLDKLMALEPSNYTFKGREISQVGFIAQNLQESFPENVTSGPLEQGEAGQPEEGTDYLSIVGWDSTAAHIVAAMKEQQAMIEELKAEIEILKGN
jgi:hypothetical protein